MNMVRRSIPIPSPDVGGIPYSSARTKSISMNIASSSPLSLSHLMVSSELAVATGTVNIAPMLDLIRLDQMEKSVGKFRLVTFVVK